MTVISRVVRRRYVTRSQASVYAVKVLVVPDVTSACPAIIIIPIVNLVIAPLLAVPLPPATIQANVIVYPILLANSVHFAVLVTLAIPIACVSLFASLKIPAITLLLSCA